MAAQRKRQQILQGALDIFLQDGYEGSSMDRIAAAAGVSKITIYKHFQDKEGVFTALVEQIAAQRFEAIFGPLSLEGDPAIVLHTLASTVLDLMSVDEQYIAFLRLILGESGRFPHLAQRFLQALPQKVWAYLGDYFTAHPELNVPNPEVTARIFMGTLMSYVMTQYILHGQHLVPMSQQVLIDALVETIVPLDRRHPSP